MPAALLQRSTVSLLKHIPRCSWHARTAVTMAQCSPFTRAVVTSMRRLYPEALADKSFDNTGLLLEAPQIPEHPRKSNSALLTIDLTKAVADEAISGNHSVVITYHPIIFRPLKSLTLNNSQQNSLLRLAANGISVYSPHTAVDAAPGGNADWLCDLVTGKQESSETKVEADGSQEGQQDENKTFHLDTIPHSRSVITPSPPASINEANALHSASGSKPYNSENTGSGRIITFDEPQPLDHLISRIAAAIGLPKALPIAIPQWSTIEDIKIKTVGLCAGSGSSVIRAANPQPDLVLTGEMSHHEALPIIERGGCIIKLFHSNSERGYLDAVLKPLLEAEVKKELNRTKGEDSADDEIKIVVSQADRDPFGIVVLEDD